MAALHQQVDPSRLPPPLYGTFSAPPPPFQPLPPPCCSVTPPCASAPPPCDPYPSQFHAVPVAYQPYVGTVATAVVAEGLPVKIVNVREPALPFCGVGIGWALFVAGFFFAAVPWYVGTFVLLFVRMDGREKAGLIACAVAATLAAITALMGISVNVPFFLS